MNESHERPRFLTLRQLVAAYPAIKLRTLRYWLQQAPPREIWEDGHRRTIPGNGLEPAIIRKGRILLIDEHRFLGWLYDDQSDK